MTWEQAKKDAQHVVERVRREAGIQLPEAAVTAQLKHADRCPHHVAFLLVGMFTRPDPVRHHQAAIRWAVQEARPRELTGQQFLSRLGAHRATESPVELEPPALPSTRFLARLRAATGVSR